MHRPEFLITSSSIKKKINSGGHSAVFPSRIVGMYLGEFVNCLYKCPPLPVFIPVMLGLLKYKWIPVRRSLAFHPDLLFSL